MFTDIPTVRVLSPEYRTGYDKPVTLECVVDSNEIMQNIRVTKNTKNSGNHSLPPVTIRFVVSLYPTPATFSAVHS
jgi:hypothetical protein